MATNLYLIDDPNVVATPTAGTKAGSLPLATNTVAAGATVEGNINTYWGGTGNIVNRTVNTTGTAVNQSYYFGRFSSKALAAQTIPAQSWNWNVIVGEASNSANTYIWPVMYVWRPSNNTVVGYILNTSAQGGSEIATTPGGATRNYSGNAVTCLDDDILVVEAWMAGTPTASVFLQTWRITANNSVISSPYTILFKPDTIFYIQQAVTPTYSPTAGTKASNLPKALNGNAPSIVEGSLSLNLIQNPVNRQVNSQASVSQQSAYFGRYSSAPLAAQTIPAQLWYWGVSIGETNANANVFNWPVLYIWRPSNNSVVGYIFNAAADYGVEWRLGADPQMNQRYAGSAVTCQDGDILVMEMWAVATQAAATSYVYDCWTTAQNSSLECPYVIQFYTAPANATLTRTEAQDTLSATASSPATGNLAQTEAPDTVSATATVQDQIAATLTRTEAADTVSADVTVAPLAGITANLSVTESGDTVASTVSVTNQLASTLTEDFDNPVIDTNKWIVTQVVGTVGFNGGVGEFTAPAGNTNRAAISSVANLDFRNQRIFHKLVQPLRLTGDPATNEMTFSIESPGTNRVEWTIYSNGDLSIIKFTNNVWGSIKNQATNIWANLATYTWLAIRETAGTTYFESAPSTAANPPLPGEWVVRHSVLTNTLPPNFASSKITFQYYSSGSSGTVTQTHKIDALNTATSPATTPSNATLAVTEAQDTISASATVANPAEIIATLAITEAPDTVVSDVDAMAGATLTRTEAQDTLVASVISSVTTNLARTEAPDTLVSAASSPATATLSVTEAPDTLSATASAAATGALSQTEAPDTVSSTAVVLPFPVINASFNVQEEADRVASTGGSPAAIADVYLVEAPNTLVATASSTIGAALARTESPDVLVASAGGIAGASLARTEAADSLASSATAPATGDLSKTEADDTSSSIVKVSAGASLAIQEAGDTLASTVTVLSAATGGLTVTEAPDTLSATATVTNPIAFANLSVTEQDDIAWLYSVHAKKRVILIT